MYEEASPGWQNTACMLAAVRGQHRHEASRGHRRVAGVMDMAELLELLSFWKEKLKWCVGRKGLLSPGLRHVELQISGRVN